ncbi:MAG: hypothetical protein AAF394_08120 [Planctomycetota bacterium]
MASAFLKLFWGLVLVYCDFKINQLDLLPDFVGYLVVALGCSDLNRYIPKFSGPYLASLALVVLSIIDMLVSTEPAFALVCAVVNCVMIWSLFGGLADLAGQYSRRDLIEKANFRRTFYVIFSALAWFATMSATRVQEPFGFLIIIGSLAACVLVLHLIYTFNRELGSTHAMQE